MTVKRQQKVVKAEYDRLISTAEPQNACSTGITIFSELNCIILLHNFAHFKTFVLFRYKLVSLLYNSKKRSM